MIYFIIIFFILIVFIGIVKGILDAIRLKHNEYVRQKNKSNVLTDHTQKSTTVIHKNGLPIPKNVEIDFFFCDKSIIFSYGNQNYTIMHNKITSITKCSGKELQKQLDAAVSGALVFGLTGALIGTLGSTSDYLIIQYKNRHYEVNYITIDITNKERYFKELIRLINNNSQDSTYENIEL